MTEDNLTLQVLRQIRDEARATNERLDATNERLDATNARLDTTNERLDATSERLEARLDTLTEAVIRGFTQVNERLDGTNGRIDQLLLGRHGQEHHELRERLERLEAWVGLDG